ncbi:hypothetical protein GALMADRAFT_134008 [Galerina marginata CBS 339.88]|uniref:Yeast cell wall synthesis Kre9/Knh1-like N-terminal domain-containing protein n=1 Tax=Galerina marginata (strain CBS 339.88) TaxID=685588 RepID=A0A067TGP2_GALM3|nr:hypothetical protein GALMADRAFT_134008 [Galerina marginata CBS 339.88]
MFFSTLFTSILLATATVAIPITGPQELIIYNPPILSPKANSSWAVGSEQVVRWSISGQKSSAAGVILLGYSENDSDHLDAEHPLATGFPITAGSIKIVLPKNTTSRNDYFIVLFGDSGNKSPKFRIHH